MALNALSDWSVGITVTTIYSWVDIVMCELSGNIIPRLNKIHKSIIYGILNVAKACTE